MGDQRFIETPVACVDSVKDLVFFVSFVVVGAQHATPVLLPWTPATESPIRPHLALPEDNIPSLALFGKLFEIARFESSIQVNVTVVQSDAIR